MLTLGLLALCLGLGTLPSTAHLFSSVTKLKSLPRLESDLLDRTRHFLTTAPSGHGKEAWRKTIQQLEEKNAAALRNISLLECPLHAFRLVKRMVKDWSDLFKVTNAPDSPIFADFAQKVQQWMKQQELWPSRHDLVGAATAIVRLHHLYKLDYRHLLHGHFLNITSYPMTSSELFDVTSAALKLGFICDSKKLLSALKSLSAAGADRNGGSSRVARLQKDMSKLVASSSSVECHCNNSDTCMPYDRTAKSAARGKHVVNTLYHDLCRRSLQTEVMHGSGTRCYLQPSRIPYLRFKAELVNSEPLIVIFYDVISDKEIDQMKRLSVGKLSPSGLNFDHLTPEQQLVRVSQNAWIFDDDTLISLTSRRVQIVTGLSTRLLEKDSHAEPYQVVSYGMGGVNGLHEDSVVLSYGLGGVYGPHEDSVRVVRRNGKEHSHPFRNSGDRTATWMYYLSDVTQGGATVFPLLGVGVRPRKGMAVFWHNLRHTGEADTRTVHAGCPVLQGDKWVANKWIREVGTTFSRPCLVQP